MAFTKAVKSKTTLKLAISGPSGSGKTYSALLIAQGLGGEVAMLDTEYKSASLYADKFSFDTWDETDPNGFPPEYFISVIKAAEQAGYKTLIIDSLTHEWTGKGGCLEIVSNLSQSRYKGSSYQPWGEVTPRHQRLVDTIQASKINIIVTMRSKMDYAMTKDEKGKTRVDKVGLAPIQRDGMDYEFTVMFDLDQKSHLADASKDRTGLFCDPHVITEQTGKRILEWLQSGADLTKNATQTPAENAPKEQKPRRPEKAREYVESVRKELLLKGRNPDEITVYFCDMIGIKDIKDMSEFSDDEICNLGNALKNRR